MEEEGGAERVVGLDGCGEVGEAGWKRQVVVRDLKSGVEEDATAWTRPDVHPRLSQYRPHAERKTRHTVTLSKGLQVTTLT